MSTINMPGFTADKSVYKTKGYYRLSAGNADGIASPPGLVQPMQLQMPIPDGGFRPVSWLLPQSKFRDRVFPVVYKSFSFQDIFA